MSHKVKSERIKHWKKFENVKKRKREEKEREKRREKIEGKIKLCWSLQWMRKNEEK